MSDESKKLEKEETMRARPVGLVQKGKDGKFEDAKPPSLLANMGIALAGGLVFASINDVFNGLGIIADRLSIDKKFANSFKNAQFQDVYTGGTGLKTIAAEAAVIERLKSAGVSRFESLMNKSAKQHIFTAGLVATTALVAGGAFYLLDKNQFEKQRAEFDADVKRGYIEIPASKIEPSEAAHQGALEAAPRARSE